MKYVRRLLIILILLICFFGINTGGMKRQVVFAESSVQPVNTSTPETTPVVTVDPSKTPSPESTDIPFVDSTEKPTTKPTVKPSARPTETPVPKKKVVKILFVGNSHTAYNNMPYMVQGMAESDGYECEILNISVNGYTLTKFANPSDGYGYLVYDALKKQQWDYVVLQENRQKIIDNKKNTESAVKTLYPEIEKAGAKLVMYVPHSDKTGDYFNINNKLVYLTNYQITDMVAQVNYQIAAQYGGLVADYGLNCMRLRLSNPTIELYKTDMLHPSVKGSYLAAYTIYNTIFGESPIDNGYIPHSEYDKYGLIKSVRMDHTKIIQQMADPYIRIDKHYTVVEKGNTGKLSAVLTKHKDNNSLDGFNNIIQWRSLNPAGISINRITGEFTALATGKYLVGAYTDSGLMDYAVINVKQPAETLSLIKPVETKVEKGYKVKLSYEVTPSDTTDSITWSSDNPGVVSVASDGTVTANSVGVAKITAVTSSGISSNVSFTVRLIKPSNIKLKKIKYKVKKKKKTKKADKEKTDDKKTKKTKKKKPKYAKISVSWKKNSKAVSYQVYRKTSTQKSYKQIAVVTTNKYLDKKKKIGKTYYYKIKAIHSDTRCNSQNSASKKITL
ncbi:MAG: hypothetical protein E7265_08750 [Lachnospiraceae bacterium]|nr:hypothetical protein [Lachnospiraceae bacterium]